MRNRYVLLALAALFAVVAPARAQTEDIQKQLEKRLQELREAERKRAEHLKKASLEELLELTLKNNPDIHVAESKLRDAEAELHRTRLQALHKVVAAHQAVQAHKAVLKEAEIRYERARRLHASRSIPQGDVESAAVTLQKVKAELARAEAELPFLLGRAPAQAPNAAGFTLGLGGKIYVWDAKTGKALPAGYDRSASRFTNGFWTEHTQQQPTGAAAAKLRAALNAPMIVKFDSASIDEVLDYIRERFEGINLHKMLPSNVETGRGSITAKEIPLGAFLQWIEDAYHVRFVIRDYGIVVTTARSAPPGAVGLIDFWKNRPTATQTPTTPSTPMSK